MTNEIIVNNVIVRRQLIERLAAVFLSLYNQMHHNNGKIT